MRLKLSIAYDGRPFGGWQVQPNADTIQERIQKAIQEVAKEEIPIHGSGRTDAGVHALAQVAHFDVPDHSSMNPYNWVPALNTKLPASIRILDCEEVTADFHARFSATAKTYTYRLCLTPILLPLDAGLSWHLPRQLDPNTLADALELLQGKHDFRAFAANRGNETEDTNYVRTLTHASCKEIQDGYLLTFSAEGFLYKMVRLLTGGAVHTAQGRYRLDDFKSLLTSPGSQKSPLCAPPDGLTLAEVSYA